MPAESAACALEVTASRRFYVHAVSFGFLAAAQPSFSGELTNALALSGASRGLDQAAQDREMFGSSLPPLAEAAGTLHDLAADALRTAFQCIVQLVPSGATRFLLGPVEQISAWCYEDGYLTYATGENAAAIMYAETGSLRRLRSEIRRSPDFDPGLQMITGNSLFLFDQRAGTGDGTAVFYKNQAARLLRGYCRIPEFDDAELRQILGRCVPAPELTLEGDPVLDDCIRRGHLMVSTLLSNLPRMKA